MTNKPLDVTPYQEFTPIPEDSSAGRALDPRSGESCVIKFGSALIPGGNPSTVRDRLRIEALKLQQWGLWHCPNVVRLLDTQLNRDPPFIVLEALGSRLDDNIPDDGLSLRQCLIVLRDVAAALEVIHAHRDSHGHLRPENILRFAITLNAGRQNVPFS